jgi:hypothetical protein
MTAGFEVHLALESFVLSFMPASLNLLASELSRFDFSKILKTKNETNVRVAIGHSSNVKKKG